MAWRGGRRSVQFALIVLAASLHPALAQVEYSVHFAIDNAPHLLGGPIFCRFTIRNTGNRVFAFRYRNPSRSLAPDYEQEPRFAVTDVEGRGLPDPGPSPCASAPGTLVYGSVTLPPGQVHTENWLLNQWAQFAAPGRYHVRAERRLPLIQADPQTGKPASKPAAFAMAIDEFNLQIERSSPTQIEQAYQPYLAAIEDPKNQHPAEAVVVLTSMPRPFFLDRLVAMADAGNRDRWDRRDVLDGMARLNTPAAWKAILNIFQNSGVGSDAGGDKGSSGREGGALRSYAVLLLAEKGDPSFIPTLTEMLRKSQEPLRGDILRALGFFDDPGASEALMQNLHSRQVNDRMNAILGLKNLGKKEVIPSVISALNDPETRVRQVANFALEGVTHHQVAENPSQEAPERLASAWHAWWVEHAGSFSATPPKPCHDW